MVNCFFFLLLYSYWSMCCFKLFIWFPHITMFSVECVFLTSEKWVLWSNWIWPACGCIKICFLSCFANKMFLSIVGQIGYALVPMIARGVMLGPDQPVILHMLDIPPAAESLNGVKMELVDAAFPLLKGMTYLCWRDCYINIMNNNVSRLDLT